MTWLVFGVSCLLVLAGAVSIISGAPIIQLERGWAEVISGTVALSSGGIVFALAGILMRLEAIRDTMVARTLPVAAGSLPAAAAPPPGPDLDRTPPATPAPVTPPTPLAEPAATPEDEGKTEGLWKRVKRPGPEQATAKGPDPDGLRQQGFPDRVVPDEAPAAAPPSQATPVVVPAHRVPADAPAASLPAPPAGTATQDAAPAGGDAGQIGWLERSLFKGRAARPDAAPGQPEPSRPEPGPSALPFEPSGGRDARVEPSVAATGEVAAPRAPFLPMPEPTAAAEPAPTPDLASEQHGGAAVVGRYQAGSASYVMYSDGTIEVETESGEVHRFGSMDELKAFIAQQETTVS